MNRFVRYTLQEYLHAIRSFVVLNPGPTALTVFCAVIVGTSDLAFRAKITVFLLMTAFAFMAFTERVRRIIDPSYEDENPNEPVVEYDIGPATGDLPALDRPAYLRNKTVSEQNTPTDNVFNIRGQHRPN